MTQIFSGRGKADFELLHDPSRLKLLLQLLIGELGCDTETILELMELQWQRLSAK
jgi:hypothetical protein